MHTVLGRCLYGYADECQDIAEPDSFLAAHPVHQRSDDRAGDQVADIDYGHVQTYPSAIELEIYKGQVSQCLRFRQ